MTTIILPDSYGFVAAAIAFIGIVQIGQFSFSLLFSSTYIYYLGIGGSTMGHRNYFSSKEFLDNPKVKELQEEHKKAFNEPINKQGYPDMGNGRYAAFLPYKKWVEFNNAQRGHYNMVEGSAPVLAGIIIGGFYNPKLFAGFGAVYGVGRLLYTFGYTSSKGADGRKFGAVTTTLSFLGITCSLLYYGLKAAIF